jgi:hypothetical protein
VNDAFVSYAREDRAVAERIVLALQSGGIAVWWDGLLIGGDDFGRTKVPPKTYLDPPARTVIPTSHSTSTAAAGRCGPAPPVFR